MQRYKERSTFAGALKRYRNIVVSVIEYRTRGEQRLTEANALKGLLKSRNKRR